MSEEAPLLLLLRSGRPNIHLANRSKQNSQNYERNLRPRVLNISRSLLGMQGPRETSSRQRLFKSEIYQEDVSTHCEQSGARNPRDPSALPN